MKTDAIVHLFDWPFARCEAELQSIAAEGYGAIQISPPQLSIDEPAWWGRYQPLDFRRLEGPLGDEAGLRRLADAAHRLGLKLFVDVVLNHMAGGLHAQSLKYAQFGPEHFHPRVDIDYRELRSIREGWLVGLPDLRTEHPHVRAEARRYLELLIDCGADGFRFDAVKHMEPEFFAAVLDGLQTDGYGEYILQPGHEPVMREFLPQMDLMDFSLHQSLAKALGPEGDWSALDRVHEDADAALPPGRGVAFVTNHDLELDQYGGFALPADGLALAHAFTVCRLQSRPLVWMDHRDDPVLRAALRLRARAAAGGGWQTLQASRQLLVWRSLDGGALLVFNAAGAPRHLESGWLGGGRWLDLVDGSELAAGAVLGPRQPGLYLRA
jgi:alpha-amylase